MEATQPPVVMVGLEDLVEVPVMNAARAELELPVRVMPEDQIVVITLMEDRAVVVLVQLDPGVLLILVEVEEMVFRALLREPLPITLVAVVEVGLAGV